MNEREVEEGERRREKIKEMEKEGSLAGRRKKQKFLKIHKQGSCFTTFVSSSLSFKDNRSFLPN